MAEDTVVEDSEFWHRLDSLVAEEGLAVDRPKGSRHPRYPSLVYPLVYGYLEDTRAGDGDGIDVWLGSLPSRQVTGIICTVDMGKRDAEIKVLVGCRPWEADMELRLHNTGAQAGMLIERPGRDEV
jgi:inorganic pyrophosphatase